MNYIAISESSELRVSSPTTYRVIRTILLSKGPFLQKEVAETADASRGQVSRITRYLAELGHIHRGHDGRYRVQEAATIPLSIFPFQRRMKRAHVGRVLVRASKDQAKDALVETGAILCLESALEDYSGYFRADRVCVYHRDPDALIHELTPHQGGNLPVDVYHVDLPLQGDIEAGRRTSKWRTLIDMACDDKTYAAKDLLQDLWGIALD